jgi:hypothetical protein
MAAMKIQAKWAVGVVAALVLPSAAQAADLGFMSARCEAAAQALQKWVEGGKRNLNDPHYKTQWTFEDATTDDLSLQGNTPEGLAHAEGLKAPLSVDLTRRFLEATKEGPLADCQDFGPIVSRLGGWYGPVERKLKFAMMHRHNERQWPARNGKPVAFIAMSMPVLSADSDDALVYMRIWCGGLCGEGTIWHLRRQVDGKWLFIDAVGISVS